MDSSSASTEKELTLLRKRLNRLGTMSDSVMKATANMKTLAKNDHPIRAVHVRYDFIRRVAQAVDPLDRRLPDRGTRPPSARLISPRGAALRFFLTVLFEAQTRTRTGQHPRNERPLIAGGNVISWIDLLASDARPSPAGRSYMGITSKKLRQVKSALVRLAEEELIALPRCDQPANKHEGFLLLHEGGRRVQGPNIGYRVPPREEAFPVPVELFTSGWIHVLEDTELAFILMVAACYHEAGEKEFHIPPHVRRQSYGVSDDAYEAHRMLSRLGLMAVTPAPGREPNGKMRLYRIDRSTDELALMHTLGFRPDQFKQDALTRFRLLLESTSDSESG